MSDRARIKFTVTMMIAIVAVIIWYRKEDIKPPGAPSKTSAPEAPAVAHWSTKAVFEHIPAVDRSPTGPYVKADRPTFEVNCRNGDEPARLAFVIIDSGVEIRRDAGDCEAICLTAECIIFTPSIGVHPLVEGERIPVTGGLRYFALYPPRLDQTPGPAELYR